MALPITNDIDTDSKFRVRYVDVQAGDRVWVAGSRFTDGLPNNVVPANSSRPLRDRRLVRRDCHLGRADLPADLTLDFGFELA